MVTHIEKSKYVTFTEEQVSALGSQARYFASTTTDVHESSSYINKSFAVDKLFVVAVPK